MQVLYLVLIVLVLLFGFVVLFGAPYLPTLKKQTEAALDLLDLKAGQTLLELGCGDGRVAKAAARRGLKVVGYELNPILVMVAKLNTWRYRKQVSIRCANFWSTEWPKCDGVFVFLLDKYMKKLDKKIIQNVAQQKRSIKLLSFNFKVPGKKLQAQKAGVYLYVYQAGLASGAEVV
jgi:SAM-dependent methyltransferase